jgi:O-antigen/teichoic acid export membrane protein
VIRATIIRNSFYGLVSQGISGLIGLALTPFIIGSLGMDTYGLWILAGSFVGYFGLIDLGIRPALCRFIALYAGKGEFSNVNRIVNTALVVLSMCGLVILAVTLFSSFFFAGLFHVSVEQQQTTRHLLWIIGITLVVGMPFAVFDAILIGHGRYDWSYKVDAMAAMLRAGTVVGVLVTGHGVTGLALANLGVQILVGATQICLAKRLFKGMVLSFKLFNTKSLKELFGLGIWAFVVSAWRRLAFATDILVVGWILDTRSVAIYSIASRLIALAVGGANSFSDVIMPVSAALHAREGSDSRGKLLFSATRVSLGYAVFMGVMFAVYGGPLIHAWVGTEFHDSTRILHILLVPMLFYIPARTMMEFLLGAGIHAYKGVACLLLADGVANLMTSLLLARIWGMAGVAAGTLFTMTLTMGWLIPLFASRNIKTSYAEYLRMTFLKVFWIVPLVVAGLLVGRLLWLPEGLLSVMIPVGVVGGIYFAVLYWEGVRWKSDRGEG